MAGSTKKDSLEFRRALMRKHLAVLAAATAEVSVGAKGEVWVRRMVLVLNCAHAVNPDQIAAREEGSVGYGLVATSFGESTVERGRIRKLNFDRYPMLRLTGMPKVGTVIVPTFDFFGWSR